MSYQYITTEREGRLFVLTINRPDVMNAISPAASHEMALATIDAERALEFDRLHTMMMSEDIQEGLNAFLEKRRPVWKGR